MKLHIVIHESFEAPAAIGNWAEAKGHEVGYSKMYQHEKLPQSADAFDFLVIMGGPQSPDTTIEQCPHFNAKEEIEFIRSAVERGKAILGVCLGAQLIGEALGARFEHSPQREIGVFELTLTAAGKEDPVVSTFPSKFLVGHWHGDMPGLTDGSEILAYSAGCPRQIVRFKPRVYGFQCHFEFTSKSIEGMVESCSEELEMYKSQPFVQDAVALKSVDYGEMNGYLYKFLDLIEDSVRAGMEVERCAVLQSNPTDAQARG